MDLHKVRVCVSLTRRVQPKKFAPFECTIRLEEEYILHGDECLVESPVKELTQKLEEQASDLLGQAIIRQVQTFYGTKGVLRMNSEEV